MCLFHKMEDRALVNFWHVDTKSHTGPVALELGKVLDLLGTCHSFLLSCFSLLEWDHLSSTCPTIVFWKQIYM